MDSWTLQGDSYSFLRSAPRTFSLCHRDGTPNHVEIFDIINVPTQRSAISETTCLCDIFGDDCESPSVSSSPAVGSFVPSQREVDGTAAAASLVDDLNDSSGSYHTAPGSSEGEEGFEDSQERLHSPLLLSSSSERCQSEGEGLSSQHTNIFEETSPDLEEKIKSPLPTLVAACPPSEVLNIGERTSSPGHKSPYTTSPEERVSPLSSSSVKKRHSSSSSSSSPNPRQAHSEAEIERITPILIDRYNSHHSLTSSPVSEPRNSVRSSSSESLNIQFSSDSQLAQNPLEQINSYFNQHSSPSPEPTSKDLSVDLTESLRSRGILSSPLPTEVSTELSRSRETLVSPDTQALSPFSELRGRVSLPDLFSRGSTPDEASPCSRELISTPSSGRIDTPSTPDSKNRNSVEASSRVSTPAPRYTPPSPVISIPTSPGLVEISVSRELGQTASSPGLLSVVSPAETRTPSISPSPKLRQEEFTPVVSYSLSPLPDFWSNCSPLEQRHTAPSPEIRITASSPEPHTDSPSSRSLTSSPHITGISYTVVQPEDRATPTFPELSHLSTPEPDRTFVSPEASSPTHSRDSICSSIVESTGTPPDSPQISGFTSSDLQPEISLSNQPRYLTPSPEPKHRAPSPEPRYHTPSPIQQQSHPPQQLTSRDPAPVYPSPEENLLATLSTDYCLEHTPPITPSSTPEVKKYSSSVHNRSPSFKLDRGNQSVFAGIKSGSPLVAVSLPIITSPFSDTEENSPQQQSTERPVSTKTKEANFLDSLGSASFSEETKAFDRTLIQKEDSYNNPPVQIKSISPTFIVSQERGSTISPVHRATPDSLLQKLEKTQPEFTTYSQSSESSSSLKSVCTPEHLRRQLPTQVRRESKEKFTQNMAHDANRRTPSPPLTRFTPVHIIAPEKPYRHWQNRGHSPSQLVAFSPRGNLNKALTNRETPNVAPSDNNSQAHCVRLGGQLAMDRELQLEEERAVARERQIHREMERERKREERVPKKEEGWQGDASYRGEQVELSFNARNRKGPESHSAALTSRETRQGLPKVHSYSESLLATRQLQQQQSLLRLASQQDTRGGGPSRRLQHPAHQKKNSALGRAAASRPCRSSSSSMGSELDEADDEVKWFTDLAFHSLSSPEVDYLDMYSSSHRSSTNISQPSTQESPAGVNTSWQAYADFRGSAPRLDNDEYPFQQLSTNYSDGLDPSRRHEMGSFECVDVALEREDSRTVRRGVPKRQILLKRKNNAEGKQDESSENSSPAVMLESPSPETHTRETVMRQQSIPATTQECYPSTCSPEPNQKNERKLKQQKSTSLDETGSKTKMATCLIKSVLSKKILSVDKESGEEAEEVNPAFEETSLPIKSAVPSFKVSPKPDTHKCTSTPQSDYGLSSESLPGRVETSRKDDTKSPKSFGLRFSNRPSSSSSGRSVSFSQSDSEEADSQSRKATSLRSEIRSEMKVPFDSKQLRTGVRRADGIKIWDETGDSANSTAGTMGAPSATGASNSPARMINRDQEFENTEDFKQLQQIDTGAYTSKPQEIRIKAVEKKKASLNVCLTPEAENKSGITSPDMFSRVNEGKMEHNMEEKTGGDEGNGNNKLKTPIHKVRDVRHLVKNKYNLSFKAPNTVMPSDVNELMIEDFNEQMSDINEERRKEIISGKEQEETHKMRIQERREETQEENRVEREEDQKEEEDTKLLTLPPPSQSEGKPLSRPHPMQIQCKAVCWKEDKDKMSHCKKESQGEKPQVSSELVTEVSRESQKSENTNKQSCTTEDTTHDKPCQHDPKMAADTEETVTEMYKMTDKESKAVVVTTDRNTPMFASLPRVPSKEREVSTAVVLIRDGSNQAKTAASPSHEDIPTPVQIQSASLSPGLTTNSDVLGNTAHSVSMFLKEKGYQADIGAVVGDSLNSVEGKGPFHKHINCLEIPLQTSMLSDDEQNEPHREQTFSSSSTMSHSLSVSENKDMLTTMTEAGGVNNKPTIKDTVKQKSTPPLRNTPEQTPPLTKPGDFEAVKRLDPTFPPRSPAVRRFRQQPIEVKSLSKETQKQGIPANSTVNNITQAIEVKSVAKNSQKPVVPPKPSCKFKPADSGIMPNDAQKPSTSTVKPQGEERSQTIVVSSPTVYRKISSESTTTSNYSRKLAVSAVSSLKPPPSKTTISNLLIQPTTPSEPETINSREQQQPAASPQSSRYTQRTTTLAPASTTCAGLISASGSISDPVVSQVTGPSTAGANQASQPAVTDTNSQPIHTRMVCPREQAMLVTSNNTNQPAAVPTTQVPSYTHQPYRRSLSSERPRRTDDLCFYASDDPPSYDERESFSPLVLPDITPRKPVRYQPSSRPPPCSCSVGYPSHPGLSPSHHHRSPHNLTPPAPPHSPGQGVSYPVAQLPLRPHQCRPDPQPMSYQPSSPKSSPLGPNQPLALYQPLHQPFHQPPPCPPHPSLMQACTADRPMQPPQHIDPRRPPVHRSPQQQPQNMAGAPYSDPGHGHSPGLPPMDPQYLCGPQSLGPSYGSEYGGDSSSLYSESSYGQTPRRVLLDPETGKYFYIEVPVQPLRKMLFDPETGQYVEVLIPQQAMSHSGLYPPSAAPYPPLHNPNMYAPSAQYMPYSAPPPPAHSQTQPQPPRYPEASAEATIHPSGSGVSYRNQSGQGSKLEPQNRPPLDQNYLENMYYVPTGMNASPNPTPPDYYHKHPSNLPPTGGERS
ncbi:hypothetical protein JOB18_007385 [Solea senegalensis]|uniref:DUF4585 domain-containing protein n=1 Tax=Solea senegalensis TaxID=28829 RepID=A0AAV6SM03_SOLSE|nr:mucin-12 [Solea senegalensis]KAG7517426.1 hypothetical protein JOB18_007385 [Solea senegalensis]